MSSIRRAVVAASLAALVGLPLPGCSVVRSLGLVPTPRLEIGEAIPRDFELILHVTDQREPASDYLVTIRRNGECTYKITLRAPQRGENQGRFEIKEAQVLALWETLRAVGYDQLDARYPADDIGSDKVAGIQAISVQGNELAKEVQAHFIRVPEIDRVKGVVLSYLPPGLLKESGAAGTPVGTSRQIVGDVQSRVFYPADDPRLKDVPTDRRQPFGTWFDAVNSGFSPAPGFQPWERGR